jgi:hypothetical protein
MKKILIGFAVVAGVGSAIVTNANKPLATRFYQALPSNKAGTCQAIRCTDILNPACTLVLPGYATYKSVDAEPNCQTAVALYLE